MTSLNARLAMVCATLFALNRATAQAVPPQPDPQLQKALQQIEQLIQRVEAQDARIRELEGRREAAPAKSPFVTTVYTAPAEKEAALPMAAPVVNDSSAPVDAASVPAKSAPEQEADPHDHMVQLPGGGPALKIRGFFDFNFGMGTDSNPLIFPLASNGHTTFQSGEFDLFMSSKLSDHLSFVSELVVGADQTNEWGLDIERLQLTYRANKYFEISGGRYHSAIGYYNTAFHHGTWFQTAAGRPFMYYFEDSGGILPVHSVGLTTTGLVPGTGSLGMHWIAEISNGRSSDPIGEPVQNFVSDKTSKAYNFATYIRPAWAPGLQVGGSYYHDRMYPPALGMLRVNQSIGSAYAVYNNSIWEFLAEGVLLTNTIDLTGRSYNSPLTYAQISRNLGRGYRPYVRYQYVHSIEGDPVNQYVGRYAGPSIGLRKDVSDYAALKIQYNLLQQRLLPNANGLLVQMAFTF